MSDQLMELRLSELVDRLDRVVQRISSLERAVALHGEISGITQLRDDMATIGEEMATRDDLAELREAIGKCSVVLQARIREDIVCHLRPKSKLDRHLEQLAASNWRAGGPVTPPHSSGS